MAVPPYVSAGQSITSAWGNDVVYTLTDLDGRVTEIVTRMAGRIAGNLTTVTTDANGYAYINFGMTFPFVPVVVANIFDSDPDEPMIVQVSVATSATQAVFTVNRHDGGRIMNRSVRIAWIAFTGGL